jgi:hypothetical protein
MSQWDNYIAGTTEPLRVEGTAIGKASVAEFVRGFEIRMRSPNEYGDSMLPENKYAIAAMMFFKYLAEIPGWGTCEPSARILTAWEHEDDGKIHYVTNTLATDEGLERFILLGVDDIVIRLSEEVERLHSEYQKKYGKEYKNEYRSNPGQGR